VTGAAPPLRRPKVLHVSIGGPILRSYFAGQLAFIRAQGFDVVIAAAGGPDLDALCRSEGVRGHAVPVFRPLRPWQDLKALLGLLHVIARERPDVVHGHTPKAALLGLLAAFLAGVPRRISHLRALPLETGRGPLRWLLHGAELLIARLSTETVAISPSLVQAYRSLPGLRGAHVSLVANGSGNGVDARGRFNPEHIDSARLDALRARIGLPARARAICFVGRLASSKGLAELAAAWAVLREQYPDLWLVLAGDVDAREPLAAPLVDRLRSDPRVRLPGYVYERELVFALAAVNVLPSHREGFGAVLLEAAALGVPSVASRVTGCVDAIVDGDTGTLVAPRSAAALTEALGRYLDQPAWRAAHGRAARERALAEFAPERIWHALAALYRTPLRPRRSGRGAPQPASSRASVSAQPARQR
jgi:glycosyltransferase involved in cell wall biosynthesis